MPCSRPQTWQLVQLKAASMYAPQPCGPCRACTREPYSPAQTPALEETSLGQLVPAKHFQQGQYSWRPSSRAHATHAQHRSRRVQARIQGFGSAQPSSGPGGPADSHHSSSMGGSAAPAGPSGRMLGFGNPQHDYSGPKDAGKGGLMSANGMWNAAQALATRGQAALQKRGGTLMRDDVRPAALLRHSGSSVWGGCGLGQGALADVCGHWSPMAWGGAVSFRLFLRGRIDPQRYAVYGKQRTYGDHELHMINGLGRGSPLVPPLLKGLRSGSWARVGEACVPSLVGPGGATVLALQLRHGDHAVCLGGLSLAPRKPWDPRCRLQALLSGALH